MSEPHKTAGEVAAIRVTADNPAEVGAFLRAMLVAEVGDLIVLDPDGRPRVYTERKTPPATAPSKR